MPKMRINCGPRGIIMTKSTATVNCTAASISSKSHSLNGRRSESICGGGAAALNWAGEECAGVVKRATLDADQLTVKSASFHSHIGIVRCRILGRIIGSDQQGGVSWLTGGRRRNFYLQLFARTDLMELEFHRCIVGLH